MSDLSGSDLQGPVRPVEDHVLVGRIRGPSGLRGDLKIEVLTDSPERFAPGSVIYLDNQPARVERSRVIRGGRVVKLDVASDRTTAESLRGRLLTVPSHDVQPLPDSSYYHFQIIAIDVWTDVGEHLGTVKEILTTGSNDVYIVGDGGRPELLIPALGDVVLSVDVESNRMTVRLPDGLR